MFLIELELKANDNDNISSHQASTLTWQCTARLVIGLVVESSCLERIIDKYLLSHLVRDRQQTVGLKSGVRFKVLTSMWRRWLPWRVGGLID